MNAILPSSSSNTPNLLEGKPQFPINQRNGQLHIDFGEDFKKIAGIYAFYNSTTNAVYVGKSGNLKSRIQSHFSSLKTDSNPFHAVLKNNWKDFKLFLFQQFPKPPRSLAPHEQRAIKLFTEEGFTILNQNGGGGGGSPRKKPSKNIPWSTELLQTPEKEYPVHLSPSSNHLRASWTPSAAEKSEGGVVYRFQHRNTHKAYIGATGRPLQQRGMEHLRNASSSTTPPLAQALMQSPENFRIQVLAQAPSPSQLTSLEKSAIQREKVKGRELFNERDGGGGPSPSKKQKKAL